MDAGSGHIHPSRGASISSGFPHPAPTQGGATRSAPIGDVVAHAIVVGGIWIGAIEGDMDGIPSPSIVSRGPAQPEVVGSSDREFEAIIEVKSREEARPVTSVYASVRQTYHIASARISR